MPVLNMFKVLAHGTDFDVDSFLATTSLRATDVWRKGHASRGHRDPETSGFEIVLGDGTALSVTEQQRLAMEFIGSNYADLIACGNAHGMENYMLFIQHRLEVPRNCSAFFFALSQELLSLTVAIKMDAISYVDLNVLDTIEIPGAKPTAT